MGDSELNDLIGRLRENDPAAVTELVRRYEPDIRRIARVRLARFGLRHLVDSEDIAQSVLGRFFTRLRAGDFEFASADKLLNLLAVIAANRVTSHARKEHRHARPVGQLDTTTVGAGAVPDPGPGPERAVDAREQVEWFLNALNPDDRLLLSERLAGRGWAELAAEQGIGTDALRKRLSRALALVGERLGLHEFDPA